MQNFEKKIPATPSSNKHANKLREKWLEDDLVTLRFSDSTKLDRLRANVGMRIGLT